MFSPADRCAVGAQLGDPASFYGGVRTVFYFLFPVGATGEEREVDFFPVRWQEGGRREENAIKAVQCMLCYLERRVVL